MTDKITRITLHPREVKTAVALHWETYPGSFKGLTIQTSDLDSGDYDLGGGVVVERKSATDFTLAIMDKRLMGEVGKLKSSCDQPVYIVEGDVYAGRFHTDPIVVREAIAWMTVLQGVPLVPSPSEAFTAELLFAMASQVQHGYGSTVVMRNSKPFDPRTGQTYLVEGLPGVNNAMAQTLLNRFGSAAAVFAAPVEELGQVSGISPQAAARIRKVLDAHWAGSAR
ncbi:MAG TPA: ERCC4 domain-containing protein [Burkholderiales bacterium]|nr:ERCC4 domain-containing protein [Burkholderiales bacterium]